MSDKKDNKKKKITAGLDYVANQVKSIATANSPYQSTNYTPEKEHKQEPINIDPFGQDNHANT